MWKCKGIEGPVFFNYPFTKLPIFPIPLTHLPDSSVLEIFPQYGNDDSQSAQRNWALSLPQGCGVSSGGYEVCTPEDAADDHQAADSFYKSAALPLRFLDSGLDPRPLFIGLAGCSAPFVLDNFVLRGRLLHSDTLSYFASKFN